MMKTTYLKETSTGLPFTQETIKELEHYKKYSEILVNQLKEDLDISEDTHDEYEDILSAVQGNHQKLGLRGHENEELKKENEKLKEENKDMRDTQGFECDADVAKFFEECGRTHYGNHIEVLKKQNEKLKKESVKLMKEQYKLLDEKDCLSRVFWTKNEKLKNENAKLKKDSLGLRKHFNIMLELIKTADTPEKIKMLKEMDSRFDED
jgi:hypothetical protein